MYFIVLFFYGLGVRGVESVVKCLGFCLSEILWVGFGFSFLLGSI